mmetsp:Transcript_9033/g.8480  ORF Transcript_9033/g.8480 Transcript_9033/m.8480 type:complete len:137 (-) Transcript_9033:4566-4976(-)
MEVEFFGVSGETFDPSSYQEHEGSESLHPQMGSLLANHKIDLSILGSNELVKSVENFDIQQVVSNSISLSRQTISHLLSKHSTIGLYGKAQLNITESRIQLQNLPGVKLEVAPLAENNLWELRAVTVTGIVQDNSN